MYDVSCILITHTKSRKSRKTGNIGGLGCMAGGAYLFQDKI